MIDFYLRYEYWFAATQLFLAMLGMGATLALQDFYEVIAEPKSVSVGIATQLIAVPLVAYIFIRFGGFSASLTVALAMIAAIPGGTVSNVFAHLAKGNTPLSISITAVTTIACLATTPFILSVLVEQYMPANFAMPAGRIAVEIGLCLLLPLVLGMLVLRFKAEIAHPFSNWCVRTSLFVILLIVIGSIGAGRLDLEQFGMVNLFTMLAFFIALAVMANVIPRLFSLSHADSVAIEMEVVVRNVNLGLLINVSLFPASSAQWAETGNIVLLALLLFGSMQLILGAVLVTLGRRKSRLAKH